MKTTLEREFTRIFGKQAEDSFFCPGRVNLIGEHIDYNGGQVMPCATTFGTYFLSSPNNDNVLRLRSLNFDETLDIPLLPFYEKSGEEWYYHPLGVVNQFLKAGKALKGLDILYHGNVPIGSGLSSSASIGVLTSFALNELLDAGFSKLDLVHLARRVENEYIGVNCGIMDQFVVAFGKKDKALVLNCDTLEYQAVACDLNGHVLAIINTNKPRKLATSKYNERVAECTSALMALQQELPINYLCELNAEQFAQYKHLIKDETVLKRATHVIEENDRVHLAAAALSAHKLADFGQLMYGSHKSLKELYEVTGTELDTIIDFCLTVPYVAGARMTGAGFGGCAIALVKKESVSVFEEAISAYYSEKVGYLPAVYVSHIGNGVGRI